jgi:hypothetical protein
MAELQREDLKAWCRSQFSSSFLSYGSGAFDTRNQHLLFCRTFLGANIHGKRKVIVKPNRDLEQLWGLERLLEVPRLHICSERSFLRLPTSCAPSLSRQHPMASATHFNCSFSSAFSDIHFRCSFSDAHVLVFWLARSLLSAVRYGIPIVKRRVAPPSPIDASEETSVHRRADGRNTSGQRPGNCDGTSS